MLYCAAEHKIYNISHCTYEVGCGPAPENRGGTRAPSTLPYGSTTTVVHVQCVSVADDVQPQRYFMCANDSSRHW